MCVSASARALVCMLVGDTDSRQSVRKFSRIIVLLQNLNSETREREKEEAERNLIDRHGHNQTRTWPWKQKETCSRKDMRE